MRKAVSDQQPDFPPYWSTFWVLTPSILVLDSPWGPLCRVAWQCMSMEQLIEGHQIGSSPNARGQPWWVHFSQGSFWYLPYFSSPLQMAFSPVSLARSRVFGRDYHFKKFHPFLSLIQWFRGGCGIRREKVAWFFLDFWAFGPWYLNVETIFLKFSFWLWLARYFTTLGSHLWL